MHNHSSLGDVLPSIGISGEERRRRNRRTQGIWKLEPTETVEYIHTRKLSCIQANWFLVCLALKHITPSTPTCWCTLGVCYLVNGNDARLCGSVDRIDLSSKLEAINILWVSCHRSEEYKGSIYRWLLSLNRRKTNTPLKVYPCIFTWSNATTISFPFRCCWIWYPVEEVRPS
jgi:hypothetical protein